MRRTTAITVACMTAAALTVTACGRSAENGGSAAGQTGAAVSTGKATGTITVWAMGAEGDNLSKLTKDFEAANPGVERQGDLHPVGRGARQVHDRDHGGQDARRRDGRHHVDG